MTARKPAKPRKLPLRYAPLQYALVDARGVINGMYDSEEEALDDVWGPMFSEGFCVVTYAATGRGRRVEALLRKRCAK